MIGSIALTIRDHPCTGLRDHRRAVLLKRVCNYPQRGPSWSALPHACVENSPVLMLVARVVRKIILLQVPPRQTYGELYPEIRHGRFKRQRYRQENSSDSAFVSAIPALGVRTANLDFPLTPGDQTFYSGPLPGYRLIREQGLHETDDNPVSQPREKFYRHDLIETEKPIFPAP